MNMSEEKIYVSEDLQTEKEKTKPPLTTKVFDILKKPDSGVRLLPKGEISFRLLKMRGEVRTSPSELKETLSTLLRDQRLVASTDLLSFIISADGPIGEDICSDEEFSKILKGYIEAASKEWLEEWRMTSRASARAATDREAIQHYRTIANDPKLGEHINRIKQRLVEIDLEIADVVSKRSTQPKEYETQSKRINDLAKERNQLTEPVTKYEKGAEIYHETKFYDPGYADAPVDKQIERDQIKEASARTCYAQRSQTLIDLLQLLADKT
jgi:hypothetical protein